MRDVADFSGKVALVTGAAGALGRAVCAAFTAAGADVVAVGRQTKAWEAGEISAAAFVRADLLQPADVGDLVKQTLGDFGGLHILVNAVGGYGGAAVADSGMALVDGMLDLNYRPVFAICAAVLPHMQTSGFGRIVNVGALAVPRPMAGSAAYAASKAAVLQLTRVLAVEGAAHGIRANAVLPGIIDTPANRAAMPNADFSGWVPPERLAETILFLCSEPAADINGAEVPVG